MDTRWRDNFQTRDFSGFWSNRVLETKSKPLIVLGLGFDPRSLKGLSILANLSDSLKVDYILIDYHGRPSIGDGAERMKELIDQNRTRLSTLIATKRCREVGRCRFDLYDAEGYNRAGLHAQTEIQKHWGTINRYTDVILDISGLPRSIFFPLLKYMLAKSDKGEIKNLHIAVVEDSALDVSITGQEYDSCEFYQSFKPGDSDNFIWLPTLTEGVTLQLERIYDAIGSKCVEVCPILPFPGANLRLGDQVIVNMKVTLFQRMQLAYENIDLCDEGTPFDIYRKVLELDTYYREKLSKLSRIKSIKTVLSPLSSKILSIGIALAAFERDLAVCAVNPTRYTMKEDALSFERAREPLEVWLTGEPYYKS